MMLASGRQALLCYSRPNSLKASRDMFIKWAWAANPRGASQRTVTTTQTFTHQKMDGKNSLELCPRPC